MPIKIQSDLPARLTLENENIFVMTENRAESQDIRPLKIAIVNLMPTKIATETQLLRLLGNTPLQVEISLVRMASHESTHIGLDHLEKFYTTWEKISKEKFDGMIITGAPVEQLPFEKVDYWNELCMIMDYAKTNVFSTLYICWGAQAGLYHNFGIPKKMLEKKLFGIYPNRASTWADPLLRGFDDQFFVPQSRYSTVEKEDLEAVKELEILAESEEAGVLLVKTRDNREVFITGHLEYDSNTLGDEYWRDIKKGLKIDIPYNYYPDNNPDNPPPSKWRSTAHLFFSNWLNYYVYQDTPFDVMEIK